MSQPLSIITAIHNGLAMNRLYWKALSENTECPFELVIVDNHSTDGSEVFFEALSRSTLGTQQAVIYIRNGKNKSYPESQIQGMKRARFSILCFLNNDIWMPKAWHRPFERALTENPLLVVSPSGQEAQPTQKASTQLKAKWKRTVFLSRLWQKLFKQSEEQRLWKSLQWMYGSLENFHSPTCLSERKWIHGIKGDSVIIHRELLKKVPQIWDERIEAADWHLYLLMASLHEKDATIPLPRILLDAYIHHFGRYSARQKFEPLDRETPFLSLDTVWGRETIERLWWGNSLPQH